MHIKTRSAMLALAALAFAASSPAPAHEGDDHGAPAAVAATASPRATAASDDFELVALVRGAELVIYLDRFRSNEPVTDATITVETPAGSVSAHAEGDVYHVDAPWAATPGHYDLIFTVAAGSQSDILTGTLEIAAPPNANTASGGWLGAMFSVGDGSLWTDRRGLGLLAAGFGLGAVATGLMRRRRLAAVVLAVGLSAIATGKVLAHEDHAHDEPANVTGQPIRDVAQRMPDGSLFVPKATQRLLGLRTAVTTRSTQARTIELPGRIIPDPNASGLVQASVIGRLSPPPAGFPQLGTPVKAGDVLAYVTPPLQAIDRSTLLQQGAEIDQQISIVERRVARYEQLATGNAIPRFQLDEAQLELQGLKERRDRLERTRREPEALVAPVSGIVASANAAAGQIADGNAVVFQIVDPQKLWVEALTFQAVGTAHASALTGDGRTLELRFQGAGFSDRNQSVPVHFAITDSGAGMRLGQLVTVQTRTEQTHDGVVLSRQSVLRAGNGQTVVFAHTGPERFEARTARVEPLDAKTVLAVAGIDAGLRIVTDGAELLNQVR